MNVSKTEISIPSPDGVLLFVGVGGVSMSALCRLVHRQGVRVCGVDREDTPVVQRLRAEGIPVCIGHTAANLPPDCAQLIYSLAVPEDAPELCAARARGVPCLSRPAFLGEYMRRYPIRIGVGGTHGKSTTTAMLHAVFEAAARRPTTLCGTQGQELTPGADICLIYESCEYRAAMLHFCPSTQLLLNAEWDHPDCYPNEQTLIDVFARAVQQAPSAVLCADTPALVQMAKTHPSARTFGIAPHADLRYEPLDSHHGCFSMRVYEDGRLLGDVRLGVPGEFQCANAAAALCVAHMHDIPFVVARDALERFAGIHRRLERIRLSCGREVYYDYAHHPTEIRATAQTLRLMTKTQLCAVFRPHTYTRTAALWKGFVETLSLFDRVLLTDIYPARETPIDGVSAEALARAIGERAQYVPLAQLPQALPRDAQLVLMGAGDLSVLLPTET